MFLLNKYTRWYNSIIERARSRSRQRFDEQHHIVPKALGGSNEPDNLVFLTPKQHYICHALLVKMVPEPRHKRSMYAAFNMMHVDANGRRYTSILYQYYKIEFYKCHSKMQKGKVRSLESRRRQSEKTKGQPWSTKKRASAWAGPTAKAVEVYQKSDNAFVGRYESISVAGRTLGADITTVWKMCEGQYGSPAPNGKTYPIRQHKGYVFRYINEDSQPPLQDQTAM